MLTYNTPSSLQDWRNQLAFIGDDEDNNIRSYGIPGAYFVNGAQNIDGQAGKEILINNYGNNQNATIYDANNQIIFN